MVVRCGSSGYLRLCTATLARPRLSRTAMSGKPMVIKSRCWPGLTSISTEIGYAVMTKAAVDWTR